MLCERERMAFQNTVVIAVVAAAATIIYYYYYYYYYYNGIPFQGVVSFNVSERGFFLNNETLFYLTIHLTPQLSPIFQSAGESGYHVLFQCLAANISFDTYHI